MPKEPVQEEVEQQAEREHAREAGGLDPVIL